MTATETPDDDTDEPCTVCGGGGMFHNGVAPMPCWHCGATGVEP